ncbi:hypothetical protein METH_10880 [Leisingera methylohalidivorans DSM 14336]|uniref:Uncharacterized protein n=1 Tax=Leisingera methylohalidivorans DSM 14336 TaxID=999552 RepID=V9VWC8_9RHOB|nr:hypothetical protein METH_10880 [Leisingera methylohalidivorans DSM 14336]
MAAPQSLDGLGPGAAARRGTAAIGPNTEAWSRMGLGGGGGACNCEKKGSRKASPLQQMVQMQIRIT